MTTYFGTLTIGATPVQLPTDFPRVNKLFVQHAPGNTGNFKVGGNVSLTMAITTPGIYVQPAGAGSANPDASTPPGGDWVVESHSDKNDVVVNQYFFHGSHAEDKLMYEIHIEV
jgi:hypothetical protein